MKLVLVNLLVTIVFFLGSNDQGGVARSIKRELTTEEEDEATLSFKDLQQKHISYLKEKITGLALSDYNKHVEPSKRNTEFFYSAIKQINEFDAFLKKEEALIVFMEEYCNILQGKGDEPMVMNTNKHTEGTGRSYIDLYAAAKRFLKGGSEMEELMKIIAYAENVSRAFPSFQVIADRLEDMRSTIIKASTYVVRYYDIETNAKEDATQENENKVLHLDIPAEWRIVPQNDAGMDNFIQEQRRSKHLDQEVAKKELDIVTQHEEAEKEIQENQKQLKNLDREVPKNEQQISTKNEVQERIHQEEQNEIKKLDQRITKTEHNVRSQSEKEKQLIQQDPMRIQEIDRHVAEDELGITTQNEAQEMSLSKMSLEELHYLLMVHAFLKGVNSELQYVEREINNPMKTRFHRAKRDAENNIEEEYIQSDQTLHYDEFPTLHTATPLDSLTFSKVYYSANTTNYQPQYLTNFSIIWELFSDCETEEKFKNVSKMIEKYFKNAQFQPAHLFSKNCLEVKTERTVKNINDSKISLTERHTYCWDDGSYWWDIIALSGLVAVCLTVCIIYSYTYTRAMKYVFKLGSNLPPQTTDNDDNHRGAELTPMENPENTDNDANDPASQLASIQAPPNANTHANDSEIQRTSTPVQTGNVDNDCELKFSSAQALAKTNNDSNDSEIDFGIPLTQLPTNPNTNDDNNHDINLASTQTSTC